LALVSIKLQVLAKFTNGSTVLVGGMGRRLATFLAALVEEIAYFQAMLQKFKNNNKGPFVKAQAKHTITLSAVEVNEAIKEYIELHSCGRIVAGESPLVFAVLGGGARHTDFEVEFQFFD
jgi:hypothetical protein